MDSKLVFAFLLGLQVNNIVEGDLWIALRGEGQAKDDAMKRIESALSHSLPLVDLLSSLQSASPAEAFLGGAPMKKPEPKAQSRYEEVDSNLRGELESVKKDVDGIKDGMSQILSFLKTQGAK